MNSKIFSGALRALIVISMLSGIFPTTSFVSADTSTSSQAPDPSSSDAIDFDYDEDRVLEMNSQYKCTILGVNQVEVLNTGFLRARK